MATPSSKGKAFDFRMSKKVAELTQVVHMLFTRNHEREVEIDALKEAYEYEIDLVIKDAKSRIAKLQGRIKELERNKSTEDGKFKSLYEQKLNEKEAEWKQILDQKDKLLQEEKHESQHLRDMLINAQKDVEKLRSGITGELSKKDEDLRKKESEIDRLRKNTNYLERKLKEGGSQSGDQIRDLEMRNDKLTKELNQLKNLFEETHKLKEALQSKNKQLEHDYKQLKKDLAKKIHDVVGNQHAQPTSAPVVISRDQHFMEYNDELERLRREISRYKMELCNREGNFNRTFADHNPVVVDSRAGKIGLHQMQILNPHSSLQLPTSRPSLEMQRFERMNREKTFSYATGQVFENESDQSTTRASSAVSGRFPPMLGMDQKSRLSRFLKQPRLSMSRDVTLTREMISKN